MSPQRHRARAGWLLGALVVSAFGAAVADDVFLENGNAFEGVIVVSETEETVKIRLAYGEMSLPRGWVRRIERAESALEIYLERRAALLAGPDAAVEDWLELARWVRTRALPHGFKEALLEAAAIDPHHAALAPLMRSLDYTFDEQIGLWVSLAELRRAALEAERELAAREQAERRARERELERDSTSEQTLSRAVEALALAELERETRATHESEAFGASRRSRTYFPVQAGVTFGTVYPIAYFPGVVTTPVSDPGTAPGPVVDPYESLRRRQPGSLLVSRPGTGRVGALSRLRRQPGSLPLGNR